MNVNTPRYGLVPATTIVGWLGDDETHCGPCGWEVYHEDSTGTMIGATDTAGRRVQPIYAADQWEGDIFCAECGDLIARGTVTPDEWRTAALTSPEYVVPPETLCLLN